MISSRPISLARSFRTMNVPWRVLSMIVVALVLALSQAVCAQQAQKKGKGFVPEVGQAGKDVVWVPTPQELVDKMLEIAKVTPKDYLIDLGSGDGRTVITAAKRGVRAHGIEYNPDMVALAQAKAKEAGVSDLATFAKEDLFKSDFSKATVITMFLLEEINEQLRPTILKLAPGTRIVSNTFSMGEWEADETSRPVSCAGWCTALMWVVPARVEGTWNANGRELKLTQNYQIVQGTLGEAHLRDARMRGAAISFTLDGVAYNGTVAGDRMTVVRADGGAGWTATRR